MAIEIILFVFITSLISGLLLRHIIQSRNDKVITKLQTENDILREGVNNLGKYHINRIDKNGFVNNDIEGAVYNSDGKRVY